ncbi:hypothetical protein F6R98_04520 [Candidatus Methylospira mobilis]|uniref:Tetratricopeptide repeat protein n=1 Tax=Candidatus Methylospira mobilis TaxID=1808979 RepID=A0A5Q0BDQ7_9GAMM|nr:hypothetical protein [Candidatus Methylospira mobilis]QFY41985.1 hypothetical protein F6R98_04520 [Candidatus Methylospira mobilis]WNV02974.1 hypothetical protein RP726_10865 [Candidatus Methylospira mobilis]
MTPVGFVEDPVFFGVGIKRTTHRRLQYAVSRNRSNRLEAERALWEVQADDPCCLQVYFALYKFYAHHCRLGDAERAARLALSESARQGRFNPNWDELVKKAAPRSLYASEAGLFYLFSLKALSFIKLRQHKPEEAASVLKVLFKLDPDDRSGASVTRALAESVGVEFE